MSYRIADAADVPAGYQDPQGRVFRGIRRALGATAFGINQVELPPGTEGLEHDEKASGQEEVYLCLRGGGTLRVDGEEIEMKPGRYVLVTPESTRAVVAGPEGMVWLVVGSVPGGAYAVREPF